jgi:hypothetical protein
MALSISVESATRFIDRYRSQIRVTKTQLPLETRADLTNSVAINT